MALFFELMYFTISTHEKIKKIALSFSCKTDKASVIAINYSISNTVVNI